jgi:hypothetical protein
VHHVLAHKVSLIALHAGGLEVNPAVGPEKVESSAGPIRETAQQTMEDLREVLGVLQTDVSIDGADLAPVPRATEKRETGRALPRGVGGGSSTRPVSDQRPRGVDADVLGLYTWPKATLLLQIVDLATGLPGLEECHSMFPPA